MYVSAYSWAEKGGSKADSKWAFGCGSCCNAGVYSRVRTGGGGTSEQGSGGSHVAASSAYAQRFADFNTYEFTQAAAVKSVSIEPDGSNIVNLFQYNDPGYVYHANTLSDEALNKLFENQFVVSNSKMVKEFNGGYGQNSQRYVPSFITTDSAVHSFRLLFDKALRDVEEQQLFGSLQELSEGMVGVSEEQLKELKGTDFEGAATRNVAFFSVGAKLLNPSFVVPSEVTSIVEEELALINAANGSAPSIIMNGSQDFASGSLKAQELDYSQFKPRAHYTRSDMLEKYWQAIKWYGTATFRSASEDEVRSALLLSSALSLSSLDEQWFTIFDVINYFVGECSDLTYYQYLKDTESVFGEGGIADLQKVTDAEIFTKAYALISELRAPATNSVPVFEDKGSAEGLRFLGERFTIDTDIMERLTLENVPGRNLPKALDIPAALGSREAKNILIEEGIDSEYPDYSTKLEEVQGYLADNTDEDTWTSNLYWTWLYMLQPLLDETSTQEGLPSFMQSSTWERKQLNTFLGSWTELRHDTEAYTVAASGGQKGAGGPDAPPPDDRGYVEPYPVLFGRLASLCQMTIDGLSARSMLDPDTRAGLERLRAVADTCRIIAEKELSDTPRTNDEYDFIRGYGHELWEIWETAKQEDVENAKRLAGELADFKAFHPDAVVSNIATNLDTNEALEQATGFIQPVYVVFPRDDGPVIGRGWVYSHYEFTVDVSDRLGDEQWHEWLNTATSGGEFQRGFGGVVGNDNYGAPYFNKPLPDIASWKKSYITDLGSPSFQWYA